MQAYLTLSPTNPALIGLVALLALGLFAWLFVTGRVLTGVGAAKVRRSVSLASSDVPAPTRLPFAGAWRDPSLRQEVRWIGVLARS